MYSRTAVGTGIPPYSGIAISAILYSVAQYMFPSFKPAANALARYDYLPIQTCRYCLLKPLFTISYTLNMIACKLADAASAEFIQRCNKFPPIKACYCYQSQFTA